VLALQDTSYFVYTSHMKTEGLGEMSMKKGKKAPPGAPATAQGRQVHSRRSPCGREGDLQMASSVKGDRGSPTRHPCRNRV
jgi:hypothetical protein